MALQNASVPQLKSLVTDAQLTAIPHFKAFLDIANHPKTWTDPLISVWQQFRDGLESALDSVLSGEKTSQQALDELVNSVQKDLDANGP
jgi:maltose-binding protein MalE